MQTESDSPSGDEKIGTIFSESGTSGSEFHLITKKKLEGENPE